MQLRFRFANHLVLVACSIPQEMRASRSISNHLRPVHLVLWSCKFPQCGRIPVLYYDCGDRQLVVIKLVEFEGQDCRKIYRSFRGIYTIYPNLIKENCRMSTCHRLDLQALRSQLVMSKNLLDHYSSLMHNGAASRASVRATQKTKNYG